MWGKKTWSIRPAPRQFCKCWRVMSMRTSILSATAHRLSFLSRSESLNTPASCCTCISNMQTVLIKNCIVQSDANPWTKGNLYVNIHTSLPGPALAASLSSNISSNSMSKQKNFTTVNFSNYVFPSYFNLHNSKQKIRTYNTTTKSGLTFQISRSWQ